MANRIKVLLVDDEDRFCKTTSKLLIQKGFNTTIAKSAEKALGSLKENPPDVILLDINMPGMDGHRALYKIKETYPKIQVIMLTGEGTRYSATRALVKDAFDYLAKPCDVEILASRIHDAYMTKNNGLKTDAKKASDIMTHMDELMTVPADITLGPAMEKMPDIFGKEYLLPRDRKKHPGVLLVLDERGVLAGILTRRDVIRAIRPEYISAAGLSEQESFRFSSIFWSGFFSDRVKEIAKKKVCEIMSELPPVINDYANLLEVAHLMWKESKQWLLVKNISRVVGIINDQDLFFEITEAMKKENLS
jgi:CheY-like chemotaxis protein